MKCTSKDIKELLPLYREQALEQSDQKRVEDHLATCEDCRLDLSLLRALAEETAPDPGEAFWDRMPSRIYQAVQERQSKRRWPDLSDFWQNLFMPRWALPAAAVGLAAVISLLFFRPGAVEIAVTSSSGDEVQYENGLLAGSTDAVESSMAEFTSAELDAAAQWSDTELASIHEAAREDVLVSTEGGIYEELAELSPQELERLYEAIKNWKQEG